MPPPIPPLVLKLGGKDAGTAQRMAGGREGEKDTGKMEGMEERKDTGTDEGMEGGKEIKERKERNCKG